MHESVNIEDVLTKLTQPPTDPRVISLINEKRIERGVLANLLHGFIRVKHPDQFEFRFVGKGKSKSVVLLLLQGHPEDSLVIKCGEKKLIGEELRKFEQSPLGADQALARGIEDWFRPPLYGHHQEYSDHYAIAFQFPSGCKSVQTLRDALGDADLTTHELISSFRTFSAAFARWQSLAPGVALPFGSFDWRDRDLARVPSAVTAYKIRHPGHPVEHLECLLRGDHLLWRDKLQNVKCTYGISHGDLNSHNLLVGRNQNGSTNWFVIDFVSASKGRHGPATDWAKLERDIKLRVLREACKDSTSFRRALEPLNDRLHTLAPIPEKSGRIGKCFALLNEVRTQYAAFFNRDRSDIPQIEYLYYLLCWNLSYCGTDEFQEFGCRGDTETQDIIVESAIHTFEILDKKIREENPPAQSISIPEGSWRELKLLKRPVIHYSVLLVTLLSLAIFIWSHYFQPTAAGRPKILPVRILVTSFDAAPGTPKINVGGGIASKLSEATSPYGELEIEQSDVIVRLGRDSNESIQHLGRERNADAVIWGSYESSPGASQAPVDIHFTPISKSAMGIRLSKTSSYRAFSVSDLAGFTAKEDLGSRMTGIAMMILGWSRARRDDPLGAIEAFSIAADQRPTPDDMIDPGLVYQYRARERSQIYQLREAIEDLNSAIEKGHDKNYISESLGLRAIYWSLLRKRNEAAKDCGTIRRLSNVSTLAFNYCAVAYRVIGNSRESAFFVNRAIQTSSYTGVEGHLYLAYLYAQLCDYKQSDREYANVYAASGVSGTGKPTTKSGWWSTSCDTSG